MNKIYPVGTRIKYITAGSNWQDFYGKRGKIVGIENTYPLIYLPESAWASKSCFSTVSRPVTIQCGWVDIELLVKKNEQLLFEFAYEV